MVEEYWRYASMRYM